MKIVDLATQPERIVEEAAVLLVEHFGEPRGWPNLNAGREEVVHVIREGFARAQVDGEDLLGWIGGLPEYNGRVWELHPVVVRRECRRRGIGRALVAAFEFEAATRGALSSLPFTLITLDTFPDYSSPAPLMLTQIR